MRRDVAADRQESERHKQAGHSSSAPSPSLLFPAPNEAGVLIHRPVLRAISLGARFLGSDSVRIEPMSALRRIGKRVVLVAAASLLSFIIAACGGSKSTADNASVKLRDYRAGRREHACEPIEWQ